MRIYTDATRLLGIDLPVLLRGSAPAAAAASEAGGFGIVVAGQDLEAMLAAIDETRAATSRPFGVVVAQVTDAALDALLASPVAALVTCGGGNRLSARIRAAGKRHLHEANAADTDDHDVDALLVSLEGWRPVHARLHARLPLVATGVGSGAMLAAAMALGAAAGEVDPLPGEHAADTVQRVVAEYAACVHALPSLSQGPARSPDRTAREAAALRENLRRRKDQMRARSDIP